MASNPYKRSDPKKLDADRKEIERSMREHVGQDAPKMIRKKPGVLDYLKAGRDLIEIRILERKQRHNPKPQREGAEVIGQSKRRKVDA